MVGLLCWLIAGPASATIDPSLWIPSFEHSDGLKISLTRTEVSGAPPTAMRVCFVLSNTNPPPGALGQGNQPVDAKVSLRDANGSGLPFDVVAASDEDVGGVPVECSLESGQSGRMVPMDPNLSPGVLSDGSSTDECCFRVEAPPPMFDQGTPCDASYPECIPGEGDEVELELQSDNGTESATRIVLPAQVGTLAPSEEAFVDLSGDPQDSDDTGVRIKNLSNQSGQVSVAFDSAAGLGTGDSLAPGFALVDGTLIVSSDIPPGELRVRYRIETSARALRAKELASGRATALRRNAASGRWRPAVRALRQSGDVRHLRKEADFVLGHHGYSPADEYVWAVVDVNSRYAAGGRTAESVPVAAPVGLVLLGAGMLAVALRSMRRG